MNDRQQRLREGQHEINRLGLRIDVALFVGLVVLALGQCSNDVAIYRLRNPGTVEGGR